MASFTDQIPQFNPYIQQMPVEAMTQVGVYKQQKYDEGLQKIQSYVDNIAGLDVIKPLHKQYLQSKLNELGGKLKTVAAGDFSNFQLVNSVGGMATQIVKDPTIQGAVLDTQKYKKGEQDRETAKKAGKSSPENDWWWEKGTSEWINDGKLDTRFNKEYIEYTDVDSKLREVADKIKEVDNSVDIPFVRDNAGNVIYFDSKGNASLDPKKGVARVDDAMLRIKTKGKSAQKILDNFYSSLDEKEKQQLLITGNYYYRGATKDTFKADLKQTYSKNKKMLEDSLVDLSVELKTNPNLSSTSKVEIEARINNIKSTLENKLLDKKLENELSQLDSVENMDDYKYKLYTQKYLTDLAEDMSYQSYQQEILNNPYAQMLMEKKKLQFQVNRAQQEHSEFMMSHGLNVAKHNFDIKKHEDEQLEKARQKAIDTPIVEAGGITTGSVTRPTMNKLDEDIQATSKAINTLDSQYRNILFPGLTKTAQDASMNKLMAEYNKNPTAKRGNNDEIEWLERRRALEIKQSQQNELKLGALESTKVYDEVLSRTLRSKKGVVDRNGNELINAEQLYTFMSDIKKYVNPGSVPTRMGEVSRPAGISEDAIRRRYRGTNYEGLADAYIRQFKGEKITSNNKIILDKAQSVYRSAGEDVAKVLQDKYNAQSKYLADRMPEYQVAFGTLNMKDEKIKLRVEQLIGNRFREYGELGALNLDEQSQFNPSTVEKLQKNPNTKYILEKKYDGSGQLVMKDGSTTQIIPLDDYQFSQYFPQYAQSNPMTNIKWAIQSSRNKTTNFSGKRGDDSAAVNAYMSGYNIPGLASTALAPLTRFDVEGSSENNGGRTDKFQVRMYVYDGYKWVSNILNQRGFVNEDGVMDILNNVGTNTYEDILKQNKK